MDTLLPVIVGGIIGVLGGLAGPPLTHWLTQRTDRKKQRAAKLEELMDALYAYHHWFAVMRTINVWGHEQEEPPSPFAKAQAIASIYFPSLDLPLTSLRVAGIAYEQWMVAAGGKRIHGKISEVPEGFKEAYEPFLAELGKVLDAATTLARAEFGT